jgi:hypothetical protein
VKDIDLSNKKQRQGSEMVKNQKSVIKTPIDIPVIFTVNGRA